MPLNWNEITDRAVQFAEHWQTEIREEAESQTFWNDFFNVFGVRRRTVATFEEKVKDIKGRFGFIDLFWRGKMLAEHKSYGKSLDKAASQAFEYIQSLNEEGREDEIPRYVVVSDFANIVLYDLEADTEYEEQPVIQFPLQEFHKHIHSFAFIPGYKVHHLKKEEPANIKAAELMGNIHDALVDNGYIGHNLERFLVRILFCFFAEDTGVFEPNAFTTYLEQSTREDGDDLGPRLTQLFEVLDTPENKRQKNLDEIPASMRYVNGGLFNETLRSPACNRKIRNAILAATRFDWSRISPAVFGSLFQSVMDQNSRRRCGAHYTSEQDILKVIRPLFLDELQEEYKKIRNNKIKLQEFHQKLSLLTIFDPACGCGNFLVLAYRELRRLEMDVLQAIYKKDTFDLLHLVQVNVDQFYGIEIQEFPVRVAESALWILDHQMNVEASERFGR
jgi:type I restriction-modification system DNA methylase subunit